MTEHPAAPTPQTDAGKALVEWAENADPKQVHIWQEHAALIEAEARAAALPSVDDLAQIIRHVDGDHFLGAGALAERILDSLSTDTREEPSDA